MNLSQRQLRMFVTTALLGNISRASEDLHISQPALSRALQEFENQLEVTLFERTTRKLALTAEGERFLPIAQSLLRDLQQAGDLLRAQASGEQGTVSIALGTAFGSSVLPDILKEFTGLHPGVRLVIMDDNSAGVTRQVAQAQVDIGIGSPIGDTSALRFHKLLSAPLGLLANPAHFTLSDQASVRDLAILPLLKEGDDTSIMNVLRLHGSDIVAQMESGIQVSSLALQLALARAGVGVAVVSALGASHRDASDLKFVPIHPPIKREVFLMTRRNSNLNPAARKMFEAIVQGTRASRLHPSVDLAP